LAGSGSEFIIGRACTDRYRPNTAFSAKSGAALALAGFASRLALRVRPADGQLRSRAVAGAPCRMLRMSWLLLTVAGVLEIAFAFGMKWSNGFTRPVPAVLTAIAGVVSIYLLSLALRMLPVGTAYAVWTGIGAVGTALVGVLFLGDSGSPARLACIGVIVCGLVGLRLVSGDA